MKKEFLRKAVHLSGIALLPILFWKREVFTGLVTFSLFLYLLTEWLDRKGKIIPFLTMFMRRCKRDNEIGRLSKGAICLAVAGILTPYLFGIEAAAVGLAQAFVADPIATIVGLRFGTKRIPYSKGKSWIGSLVFFVAAIPLSLVFLPFPQAILMALVGTIAESLPLPEWDNLTVPLTVGLAVAYIF